MNPIIKEQLKKCRVANIPDFDDDTTHIIIEKGSKLNITPFEVGKCYLVELSDYIINPPPDFTLAVNWNNGVTPRYKHYKCEVSQLMGKMVKIQGCGYKIDTHEDTLDMFVGWVPQDGIKLLQKLD